MRLWQPVMAPLLSFTFCWSRPPLALFLCSLLLICVTCLSLAMYVHTTDNMDNPDILDWNRLLSEMSNLKYCMSSNTTLPSNNKSVVTVSRSDVPLISQPSLTNLTSNATSFTSYGLVPLDNMGLDHIGHHVSVSLHQRPGESTVCVEVRGSDHLLSKLHPKDNSTGLSPCPGSNLSPSSQFLVHPPKHLPHSWCSKGTPFVLKWPSPPSWATHLTSEEKQVSVSHLLLASGVILLSVILITVWVGLTPNKDGTTRSRSAGDGRGDMQLLPTQW